MFGIFFDIMAALSCYEITRAAGVKNKELMIFAMIFSFLLPLTIEYGFNFALPLNICIMIYIILLVLIMLANHDTVSFENLCVTIYASVIIPFAYSTFTLITDLYKMYPDIDRRHCIFLIWFGINSALFTDVFAYFVGVKFGKHKMAPSISPKKSIEGAVGGVVLELAFNLLALFIFTKYIFIVPIDIPVWSYCIMSVVLSLCGIAGDLIASLIKRNYGIKDFSDLIPGHGGIMDRFDSTLLTCPMLYIMIVVFEMLN